MMCNAPGPLQAMLAIALSFAMGLSAGAHAQSESASIRGSVTDPTGAVIPGAAVRLMDVDRGLESRGSTRNDGLYSFASVRPGHYSMEVEKPGFKLVRLTGIAANIQDDLEENFKLTVGDVSESVTVEADTLNLKTTDGAVSTVVDRHSAENLPLNGRSFQTLIMLTPGVVVTATAFDDQGQFSVNGQRADANYFTIDGVSANFGVTGYGPLAQTAGGALPALSALGGTNSIVSVDAMQEFRIQTSSFAPEFGRTPGGQVAIVTRSGTNSFHGTLFEYLRNNILDAADWFVNFNDLPKPEDRQNDFGGVFGGPIRKDKTYFYFSYEGLRLRQPSTQETVVPDSLFRQEAPAAIRPYLNAYPVANGPELGAGLAQYNAGYSNPSSLDASSVRMDQVLNPKLTLFGRYDYSRSTTDERGPNSGSGSVLSTTQSLPFSLHTFTVGLTEIINSGISNDIRANYSNDRAIYKYASDNFGDAKPLPDSALFPTGFTSGNSVFQLLIEGAGELATGKYSTDEQRQVNLVDNLSVTTGLHQLKFGADYRWLSPFSTPFAYLQLAIFSGITSSPGGALSGTASLAGTYAAQNNALVSRNFSFYGQDTWKVTPKLTVTYGLRWDINPALKGKNPANDPYTVIGLNDPATMMLAPRGTPLYQTTYGNVAPRLGLAYQLNGRQKWGAVMRGGFGVFYDLGSGSLGGTSSYFPYLNDKFAADVPFPLSPENAAPPVLTDIPPVNDIFVAEPNLRLPRTYEWNVAFEQALGSSQSLSLAYIGAVGRNLLRNTDIVNPNKNFGFVAVTSNSATSNYQALQVKVERRLSQGLQALASYTWSRSIDIASTDAFGNHTNTPTSVANPNIDRGNSDFDIRHAFTAGVTYDLPSPGLSKFAHSTLGGWSVDAFIFARTAPPVDIVSGLVFADGIDLYPRPNVVPGVPLMLYGSQFPGRKAFNPAAFTPPPTGQQGYFGRNVLRGFGAWQADVAFQRQFHFTEKVVLRFRGEFFNFFNHPNIGPPDGHLTGPLFGQSRQTLASSLAGGENAGFNPLYQIGGPRSAQLAAKLQF